MSKRHGASKKRKKAARKRSRTKSPASLLAAAADALNACEARGVRIRFAHGAAICEQGILLPPIKKGQGWEARPFRDRPDSVTSTDDLDD